MTDRKICHLYGVDLMRLNDACIRIREAFSHPPYLVGSANTSTEYRDVDVRTILSDEEFDELFGSNEHYWSLFCMAVSEYLRAATGLPVDYQVQRQSVANEKYPEGVRHPLGRSARLYAGGGDAT